jgi:hypothetical protein
MIEDSRKFENRLKKGVNGVRYLAPAWRFQVNPDGAFTPKLPGTGRLRVGLSQRFYA